MLIAVDRNPYAERAVLLGPHGLPLTHFVGSGHQSCENWLNKTRGSHPGVPIVASPLDQWPEWARTDPDIHWLHPGMVKRLYSVCQPYNLHRKLHRAKLFGYLYEARACTQALMQVVREFEAQSAHQIISGIL